MNNWNGLDFFIFLIFFLNTILGMVRGATREIISMMCLSVGLIFTIKFTIPLANFINSSPLIQDVLTASIVQNFMMSIGAGPLTQSTLNQLSYCLSVLICFVGAFTTCEAMLNFTGFVEIFPFPYAALNRKLGAALGCTRGYIFSVVFILVLMHMFSNSPFSGSYFFNLFQGTAQEFDVLISEQQPESYNQLYKNKNLYNVKDVLKNVHT